jgi:hypothetical protein
MTVSLRFGLRGRAFAFSGVWVSRVLCNCSSPHTRFFARMIYCFCICLFFSNLCSWEQIHKTHKNPQFGRLLDRNGYEVYGTRADWRRLKSSGSREGQGTLLIRSVVHLAAGSRKQFVTLMTQTGNPLHVFPGNRRPIPD